MAVRFYVETACAGVGRSPAMVRPILFCTALVTGPGRSLSLELSDTRGYEPQVQARLGTAAKFCKVTLHDDPEGSGVSYERSTPVLP